MTVRSRRWVSLSSTALLLFVGGLVLASGGENTGPTIGTECGPPGDFSPYVDASGCIMLPANYETEFVSLGAYFITSEGGMMGGKEAHFVFTQKSTVEAFKRTGQFPDGAVLVKSVRKLDNAQLTTGNAHWAADQMIWFVMVKDSQNRFPDNPLWDEGWGWALFEAKDPNVNVATSFRENCFACHVPRRDKDWVYIEGYPILR